VSRLPRWDPEGTRLPIKLDTTTNGEFAPVPLPDTVQLARREALRRADAAARRLGLDRRRFLVSACGAVTSLLALNDAFAASGPRGGFYDVSADAALDADAAAAAVSGNEFIFDVQGHHVNPHGDWRKRSNAWQEILAGFPWAECGERDPVACFSAEQFVREVFLDSDTDLAVLSFVPEPDLASVPLSMQEADATRALVDRLEGSRRLLLHGPVQPNFPGELDRMQTLASRFRIAAWKTYTQFGPDGRGFWLDDEETGLPFLEQARALGVRVVCIHKGFPIAGMDLAHSTCGDVARAARRFPDLHFIVYHSGYQTQTRERAFDPAAGRAGIDSLVRAVREQGIGPGGNVYAELGSTWRFLMRDPDQAAHALGKLLRYLGEDNVLWGTDSIWYGSPQDQIQAFRSFQIAEPLRERHGYPTLTPALRAKVLGLNAARPYAIAPDEIRRHQAADALSRTRAAYAEAPDPSFATYGPRTRREFLRLQHPR
jgi:hypothetical protein